MRRLLGGRGRRSEQPVGVSPDLVAQISRKRVEVHSDILGRGEGTIREENGGSGGRFLSEKCGRDGGKFAKGRVRRGR